MPFSVRLAQNTENHRSFEGDRASVDPAFKRPFVLPAAFEPIAGRQSGRSRRACRAGCSDTEASVGGTRREQKLSPRYNAVVQNALWDSLAADAGLTLLPSQRERLSRFIDLLIDWNAKLNLTRIADRQQAEVKHVADALTLLPFLPGEGDPVTSRDRKGAVSHDRAGTLPHGRGSLSARVADVGTGGGVPGVPLAIARPDLSFTLIDSTRKKLDAIDAMVSSLGISNVKTLHARVETVQARFDLVVCRALASVRQIVEWCWPIVKPGGRLVMMKGPRLDEELIEAESVLKRRKLAVEIIEIDRPELAGHRIAVMRANQS